MNEHSIAICGNGVMGQLVRQQIAKDSSADFPLHCTGCVGPSHLTPAGLTDYPSLSQIPGPVDGIIDFSHPDCLSSIAEYVADHPVPLVIATTGHSPEQIQQIRDLARRVPVVFASNFSPGITILSRVLRQISPLLAGWDIEIVEMHHSRKLDAPSGTALSLANAIDGDRRLARLCGRHGNGRRGNEIGLHAIRGGSVSGKHDVIFASPDEILTLSHEAHDRGVFSHGAVLAMKFALLQQGPGLFSMEDVMFGD